MNTRLQRVANIKMIVTFYEFVPLRRVYHSKFLCHLKIVSNCIFESQSFLDIFMLIRNIEMFFSLLSFLIPPLSPSLCLPLGF